MKSRPEGWRDVAIDVKRNNGCDDRLPLTARLRVLAAAGVPVVQSSDLVREIAVCIDRAEANKDGARDTLFRADRRLRDARSVLRGAAMVVIAEMALLVLVVWGLR